MCKFSETLRFISCIQPGIALAEYSGLREANLVCSVVMLICVNILRSTKKLEPIQHLAHITKPRTSLKSETYEQVQVVRIFRI